MAGDRRTELRADIVGEDRLSPAYSAAGRSVRDLSGKMEMAAQVSLALGEAFKRQRAAVKENFTSVLELAKADESLSERERELAASALEADVALRREADAKKKSADAAKEAEARNKALRDSMKGLSFNPGIAGPALLAAPLAASLAGVGAGAALGLGGMAVAGGGALAAFAAIAKPVLADTLKAEQQVQAAQDKYNVAIANGVNQSKAYAAEQKAIGKAYAELSPQQIALSKQLGAMASAWQDLKAKETPVVAGALQPWLKSVTDLTRNLAPIIAKVSPVIGALGAQFDRLINSAAFKGFRDFIANTGSKVVGAVGGTLIDFVKAFMILLPKFNPLIMDMTHGIAGLGPAMLKWANSKSTADHITRFMDWFRQNGPAVRDLLKNVGAALKTLAPGIGTASVAELNVVSGFFGMIAKLPPGLAKPLMETAGALLLLNKLGVVKVGLKLLGPGAGAAGAAEGAAGAAGAAGLWSKMLPGVRLAGGVLAATIAVDMVLKNTSSGKGGANWFDNPFGGSNPSDKVKGSKPNALSSWDQLGHDIEHDWDMVWQNVVGRTRRGVADVGVATLALGHNVAHGFDLARHDVASIWNASWNDTIGRARRGVDDAFKQVSNMRHNTAGSFDQIRHDIASKWDAAWNDTIGRARRGVDDAFKQVSIFRHNTASSFDGARHDASSIWNSAWNNIVSWTIRGVGNVSAWLTTMWRNSTSRLSSLRNDAAIVWNAIWTRTLSQTASGVTGVVRWFGTLPGSVSGALRSLGGDLSGIARAAMGQLLAGARSQVGGITSFFSSFASGIVGVFKKIWGWFSPSAVMYEGGKSLMQGLMGGIKDHAHQAVAAAAAAAQKVLAAGSGVQRWAGTVRQALSMLHLPQSLAGRVLYQMQTESGGNPNIVNRWDINAAMGHPSQGLMQVIPGTFSAYHVGGTSWNILDPLANIAAAINYARNVYGPSLGALGSGHGYAFGTMSAAPGWAWVGEHGPELMHFRGGEQVIPSGAARGGGSTYIINVAPTPLARPADIGRDVVGAIREHEKRAGIGWRS